MYRRQAALILQYYSRYRSRRSTVTYQSGFGSNLDLDIPIGSNPNLFGLIWINLTSLKNLMYLEINLSKSPPGPTRDVRLSTVTQCALVAHDAPQSHRDRSRTPTERSTATARGHRSVARRATPAWRTPRRQAQAAGVRERSLQFRRLLREQPVLLGTWPSAWGTWEVGGRLHVP